MIRRIDKTIASCLGAGRAAYSSLGVLISISVLAVACGETVEAPTPTSSAVGSRLQRVVLISLDTLRLDTLEGSDDSPTAMPRLQGWAAKGVSFERHYAASSTTQPTHASLLTGLHPWQHGVSRNGQVLNERHVTLAEQFAEHGFRTGGVVASFPLHRSFGYQQGFEAFDDAFEIPVTMEWSGTAVPDGAFYSLGSSITSKAIAMVDQFSGDNQFLWFHYFDAHAPYGDAVDPRTMVSLSKLYEQIRANSSVTMKSLEEARSKYRADAGRLDRNLDDLLKHLYSDAERVDTHVLVVTDHGESFGEGGSLGHGKRLGDELIRVPSLLISPQVKAARVRELAASVDAPATLLGLAGIDGFVGVGRNLSAALPPERSVFGMRRTFAEPFRELRLDGQEHLLPDLMFFAADRHGVTTGNAREIVERPANAPTGEKARKLFAVFEEELAASGDASELDEESRAALEALGYVQ